MAGFVQQREGFGGDVETSSQTLTSVSKDNLLWVVFSYYGEGARTVIAIEDTLGTEFARVEALSHAPGDGEFFGYGVEVFVGVAADSGDDVVTVTINAAPDVGTIMYVAEYEGLHPAVHGAPAVNYQLTPGTGTGAVTSGNTNITLQPAWKLGFSIRPSAFGAGPNGASGTQRTKVWDAGAGPFATPMDQRVTATGNSASTFTALANEPHHTFQAVFLELAEPGTATEGNVNGWVVTATATNASGVAPFSYQWQRSARNADTWSDVAGQTSLSLVDRTVTEDTDYDYRLRYTDAASNVTYSNVLQIDVPERSASWTIVGDSQTDEYRADDDRAAGDWEDFVLSWVELLAEPNGGSGAAVHDRGLDVGTWGTRAEPRRTGFEYNWARSGATMESLIADQLSGAVAQIEAGTTTHAALWVTANEWVNPHDVEGYNQYVNEIYNSPDGGVNTETLGPVADVVSDLAQRITDVIDAFVEANVAGMAVVLTPDYMTGPMYQAVYTDATRRGYVSQAIEDIAALVEAHVSAINAAAGTTVVATSRPDDLFNDIWATADGTHATVAGLRVNYVQESNNQGPLYFAIVPDGGIGISHPGALAQSVYANVFLLAANDLPGIDIEPFSDQEMRQNAGIDRVAALAVTEALDTFAASVGSGIEGSLAVTEPRDVAAIDASVTVAGALAATEARDVAEILGAVSVQAALAVTEPNDTAAVDASVLVQAALNATEARDTAAISGSVSIEGDLSATEANDVAAVDASVLVQGSLAVTEALDVVSINAASSVEGSLAVTEPRDVAAIFADVHVTGSLAATEARDVISINAGSSIQGALAVTEPNDTAAVDASVLVQAALTSIEPRDVAAIDASVTVAGALAATEPNDGISIDASVLVQGVLSTTEALDVVSIDVQVLHGNRVEIIEPRDVALIVGRVLVQAELSASEALDVVSIRGRVVPAPIVPAARVDKRYNYQTREASRFGVPGRIEQRTIVTKGGEFSVRHAIPIDQLEDDES